LINNNIVLIKYFCTSLSFPLIKDGTDDSEKKSKMESFRS
jgi:hypothetical protein